MFMIVQVLIYRPVAVVHCVPESATVSVSGVEDRRSTLVSRRSQFRNKVDRMSREQATVAMHQKAQTCNNWFQAIVLGQYIGCGDRVDRRRTTSRAHGVTAGSSCRSDIKHALRVPRDARAPAFTAEAEAIEATGRRAVNGGVKTLSPANSVARSNPGRVASTSGSIGRTRRPQAYKPRPGCIRYRDLND